MVTSRTCIRLPHSSVKLKMFQASMLAFNSRQLKHCPDPCTDVYAAPSLKCCAMLPVPYGVEIIQRIMMSKYIQTIFNEVLEETTSDHEGIWDCISIRKMEEYQKPRNKSSFLIAPKENLLVSDFLILIHHVDEGELRMEVSSMLQRVDSEIPLKIQ